MARISTSRHWLGLPLIAAVAVMSACTTTQNGSGVGDESTAQADKTQQAQQGPLDAKVEHRFGPEQMLRDALSQANLTADQQKTIDAAMSTAFQGKDHAAEEGRLKPLFSMAADQVRSGKIDEASLNAKIAELSQDAPDHRAKAAQALQTVHDTLTADQRATVVSAIQAKVAKFEAFEGPKGEGKMHERGEHKGEGKGLGKLGFLLHGVDLQEGQLDKIKAALKDAGFSKEDHAAMEAKRDEMKQKMDAMLEAFKADQFDAKTALPERGEMGAEHLGRMVKAMAVIVPLLDDTQRTALAKNIENGPQHPMWHGHPGMQREGAPAEINE